MRDKRLPDVRAAILASGLRDGGTVSFHHHLRNGDDVLRAVMVEIAALGLRNIHIAASSVFPVHDPLVRLIREGVVTGITTSYMSGPVADAVVRGLLPTPAILQTHGGRARAIEAGETVVDVAFIAAPAADACGNLNGVGGKSACGTLGYPMVDARHALVVVAVTDTLVPYPNTPIDIPQTDVDFVVCVPSIGDPALIVSGTTRATTDPQSLHIADQAAQVIAASGLLIDGFSFQTGAGGASLAVAQSVRRMMVERGITGSFAAGGITGAIVDMFEAGLFRALLDVQCFDLRAVDSYRRNAAHMAMSASMYGNPATKGTVVDMLDVMILGAAEVDIGFNVNVTTATDGRIIGGSGGHSDTAAGAKLAIVTTPLATRLHPKIVERVTTVTTPGHTIDVVVTEDGIAVNPAREDLQDRLIAAGLPVVGIEDLQRRAALKIDVAASGPQYTDRTVAICHYRDGSVIDAIKGIRK